MGQIKPEIKVLSSWRILLSIVMIVPAFLNALFFRVPGRAWLVASGLWLAAFLLLYLVYLPLRYRNLSFSVTEDQILLYGGVLYARSHSILLCNIQFTTLRRNPFERMFGLCSVVVVSAGGRISIPGLRLSDGEKLAKLLLEPQ